eukprot:5548489-Pyramimonas_sp.AAC.2
MDIMRQSSWLVKFVEPMLWCPTCISSVVWWTAPPPAALFPNSQFESDPSTIRHLDGACWIVLYIHFASLVTVDFPCSTCWRCGGGKCATGASMSNDPLRRRTPPALPASSFGGSTIS